MYTQCPTCRIVTPLADDGRCTMCHTYTGNVLPEKTMKES